MSFAAAMRWIVISSLLAVTVFAQARPAGPAQARSTEPSPDTKLREDRAATKEQLEIPGLPNHPGAGLTLNRNTIPLARSEPCAIPLINVTPKDAAKVDQAMIIPSPPKERFTIKEILPLLPSCRDAGR